MASDKAIRCKHCGQPLVTDQGCLVDPTGGDVCGVDGTNSPHEPDDGNWQPAFNADRSVLVAADSWEKLRRCDVFRLFDSHCPETWGAINDCLSQRRPDLIDSADKCLEELRSELAEK